MQFKKCSRLWQKSLFVVCLLLLCRDLFAETQLNPISSPSVEVDPHSGSASLSIPISVPQGRGGIQPALSLSYNSSTKNGMLGMGWTLNLGMIGISTKQGIPRYDNTEGYVLHNQGSRQELVYDADAGFYRVKTEGAFMRIVKLGSSWEVTDKKGIKYYFGLSSDSRLSDPSDPSRIFQWHLDKVEDLHGNYMEITYLREDNYLYPDEIRYTGHEDTAKLPFANVTFQYEARTDYLRNFQAGFSYEIKQRLSGIEVKVGDALLRRYQLSYDQTSESANSRLSSVVLYGSDGTSFLPQTLFTYSQGNTTFKNSVNLSQYPATNIGDGSVRMLDMNGDSLVDMIRSPGTGQPWYIYYNTSSDTAMDFAPPVEAVNAPYLGANHLDIRYADIDGDGLTDIIDGSTAGSYKVHINNGVNGFHPARALSHSPNHNINWEQAVQFMDMNGDGLVEMLATYWGHRGTYTIYRNNGNNDFDAPVMADNSPDIGCDHPDYRFADFNGDGLQDVILGNVTPYRLFINNGVDGYAPAVTVSHNPGMIISTNNIIHCVDMNGDGLADLLETYTGNNQDYKIYFNNGNTDFNAPVIAVNSPIRGADNTNIKLLDMNGDGLTDVFFGTSDTGWHISLNNGYNGYRPSILVSQHHASAQLGDPNLFLADINGDFLMDMMWGHSSELPYKVWENEKDSLTSRTDILTNIDNSSGVQTRLEYTNTPVEGLGGLYLMNTVESKTITTDLGASYTTTFQHEDGLWDREDREFRGFATVRISDVDGNYSETDYLQDDIYKGRPDEQRTFSSVGKLYGKTVNTWNHEPLIDGVNFVYLARTDNFVYDGDMTGRRTADKFYYEETPQYGNLTRKEQWGEVDLETGADIGNDSRSVETAYVNNPDIWLLGLPRVVRSKDHDGMTVRKTWFDYDGHANTDNPVLGLVTSKENWAGDGPGYVNPRTQYAYDAYGNVVTTTDPKNNVTAITYDPDYQMFPVKTTNALGHQVENQYYGVNGVPLISADGMQGLWGQVKTTTDPNEQAGSRVYDAFGRITATIGPFDTISYPSSSMVIEHFSTHTKVLTQKRVAHGEFDTLDAVSIYDGLGRLVQTKTRSETPGQYVISGQSEYNARGLAEKKYLPYFTANTIDVLDSIDPAKPHTSTEYDAMGRVSRITNPDGTYSTIVYDDWTTKTYDENGHKQESDYDAYGRLIEKREYTGADGRSPYYPQTAFNVYASTTYSYDTEGNLVRTVDDHGNTTTITYDHLGHKTSMDDPDMGYWQYTYDINGNLETQTDAKGQVITFTNDELNRLAQKTDGVEMTVDYTYDDSNKNFAVGRLTKAEYGNGLTEFAYDELGREIWSNKIIAALDYGVERQYGALNNLLNVQYPDQTKVYYQYNLAGQVESVSTDENVLPQTPEYPEQVPSPVAHYTMNDDAGSAVVSDAMGTYDGLVKQAVQYTGDITSGGVSSASSCLGGCSGAYSHAKAFDNIKNVHDGWVADNTPTGWLRYDFSGQKQIVRYDINARGAAAGNPRSWTFQAYNGSGWVTLDARSGYTWTYPETKMFTFNNSRGYQYYRLNISANNGHPEVGLAELELMEFAPVTTSELSAGGLVGGALQFNGTGQYLNADELAVVAQDMVGTIAFWVNPSQISADDTLFSISQTAGSAGLEITAAGSPEIILTGASGSFRAKLPNALFYDQWSHIVIVQDGTAFKAYLNGQEVALTVLDSSLGQDAWLADLNGIDNVRIASRNKNQEGEARFFGGKIDDFRYYRIPLSADEVNALYHNGNGTEARNPEYYVSAYLKAKGADYARNTPADIPSESRDKSLLSVFLAGLRFLNPFYAQEAYAMAEPLPPAEPPVITAIQEHDRGALVHWDPPEGTDLSIKNYTIHCGARIFTNDLYICARDIPATATSYDVTEGLTNDMSNALKVIAQTNQGALETEEVYITPHAQPRPTTLNNLSAADKSVHLSWSSVQYADGYRIKYGTSAGTYPYSLDVGMATSYTVDGLANGETYYFVIATMDDYYGECGLSNERSATPHGVPEAPVISQIEARDNEVMVHFNDVAFAENFKIQYGISSGNYTDIKTVGVLSPNSHTVTGLINGQTYYFVVAAVNNDGESGFSNEVSAAPVNIVQVPEAPVLHAAQGGVTQVGLTWSLTENTTGYKIFYGTQSGVYAHEVAAGDTGSYTVTGLDDDTDYYFAVVAYNEDGESPLSNELAAGTDEALSSGSMLLVSNVDYNAAGQITRIAYGNGTVTENTYNELTLRLTRVYTVNAAGEVLQDLNYTYDSVGNILTITDNSGAGTNTQSFQYDELNRLTQATGEAYGTKTYAYDEIGNIIQKDGLGYTYGENGAGPHAVTSLSDGSSFGYDANGNMVRQYRDNVTTDYIYDGENRLIQVEKDGITIAAYEYDGDGGRTKKQLNGVAEEATCFLAGTRVVMADGSLKPIEDIKVDDEVLSYNEKTMEKGASRVTKVFAEGYTDEYLILNNQIRVTKNHLFYSRGEWRKIGKLAVADRLLNMDLTDAVIDSIEKVKDKKQRNVYNIEVAGSHNYFVTGSAAKDASRYLVHNKLTYGNPAGEDITTYYVGSLYEETNGNARYHVFLGNQQIASISENGVTYYHRDHLGGTNITTGEDGSKKELVEYKPFGEIARQEKYGDGADVAWFYFTGKPKDDETGLYYYGARYYDPSLGRFIAADSIVQSPDGNPQTFNRYSYCGNNPVNFVDPTGHFFTEILGFLGAAGLFYNDYQFASGQISASEWGVNIASTMGSMVTLDMTGASLNTLGEGGFLLKSSAAAHITSQVAGYAGAEGLSQGLGYASQGLSAAFFAWNMGRGVKDWIHEDRFSIFDINGEVTSVADNSHVHINGIMTNLNDAQYEAFQLVGADYLAYNPTSGLIADLTESVLGILTGTSSVSRQVASSLVGLSNISLTGFSQGGIIAGNVLVNLGLQKQCSVINRVGFINTQINQPRAYLAAALAGVKRSNVVFTTHVFDFSNLVGFHTNPINFAGGVGGTLTLFGGINAHGRGPEIYGAYISGNR